MNEEGFYDFRQKFIVFNPVTQCNDIQRCWHSSNKTRAITPDMAPIIALIAAGAMAWNGTLADVHTTRNELYGAGLPEDGFVCRVGVQHRYGDLLGKTLYFYDFANGEIIGPLLVVDMAAPDHSGIMEQRGIAADTDCRGLVHSAGILFLFDEVEYQHGDIVRVPYSDTVVARSRNRLRVPHRLCGGGVDCHWRVENWIWN